MILPYVSVSDYLITLTLNYSFYQYSFLFPLSSYILNNSLDIFHILLL